LTVLTSKWSTRMIAVNRVDRFDPEMVDLNACGEPS